MIGALWTGISGLSSQQQALDNESNNIANVNTIGFKASRISFADQMYQDRIGKGSKVLDAEKLYTQGNLKLTGVNYDMALSGDGFFTVVSSGSSGSASTLYTRAGNFRMGDNGTLQDAAGNEVQGWMMTAIDSGTDVTSTNSNVSVFNSDYTKLLGSKVVSHSNYIETITAKATDYTMTAKSDSTSIFSGDGSKSKSSKVSDIEEAIKDYTTWLQKLKDEPDSPSSNSIAQTSEINFKSGTESVIGKDGDQVYAYIDGNKVFQNFLETTATTSFKKSLADVPSNLVVGGSATSATLTPTVLNNSIYSINIAGKDVNYVSDNNATATEITVGLKAAISAAGITPTSMTSTPTTSLTLDFASDTTVSATTYTGYTDLDKEAGKVATYKALADKISQIPGLVASMVVEGPMGTNDVLESADTFKSSTKNIDMIKGIIQIKSLIPGDDFLISEVGEVSGNTVVQGNYQNSTTATKGSGIGALQTSRDALSRLITGKQQDVYSSTELGLGSAPKSFTYGISIYDKEIATNIPVPNDGGLIPQSVNLQITNANSIDDVADQINANEDLSKYVVARNVNGNLVVETLDSNYDVEFTGNLKQTPSLSINLNNVIDNATYTFNILGQVITVPTTDSTTQSDIRTSVVSQIAANATLKDNITVSDLINGSFSINPVDSTIDLGSSTIAISDEVIPALPAFTPSSKVSPTFESNTVLISPVNSQTYTLNISGQVITYDSDSNATSQEIYDGLSSVINANPTLTGISIGALSTNSFTINQTALQDTANPTGLGITSGTNTGNTIITPFVPGTKATHSFSPVLSDSNSSSVFTLNVEGVSLSVRTDSTPNITELSTALSTELSKNPALAAKISISVSGSNIVITNNQIDNAGYVDFSVSSSLSAASLTANGDGVDTLQFTISEATPIDANSSYSGRKGAGAEFIEIVNKVDQTASKGSLQLRLDTLGISDSAFGEFSVDSTGLITMKQDGADFAIGQVAIALFNNNRGLDPMGDNLLGKTNESGDPVYNLNNNKTAKIESKTLELSTADLSESLVNLMVFQRAFEANAKSITTSDELLNTLINLKR